MLTIKYRERLTPQELIKYPLDNLSIAVEDKKDNPASGEFTFK